VIATPGEQLKAVVSGLAVADVLQGSEPGSTSISEFRRLDRKYVISEALLSDVLQTVSDDLVLLRVAQRTEQRYHTTYLDTANLSCFHSARARRPQRFKVRLRRYNDEGSTYFEVKVRQRTGLTVKNRRPWGGSIDADTALFLRQSLPTVGHENASTLAEELDEVATTSYARQALLFRSTTRLTIDSALRVGPAQAPTHELGKWLIVETKSEGPPTVLDRRLWSAGVRPAFISKYALAVAATDPSQPTNRWTRFTRELQAI
jgi:hypothetical protein